jgi:hypothetical protein
LHTLHLLRIQQLWSEKGDPGLWQPHALHKRSEGRSNTFANASDADSADTNADATDANADATDTHTDATITTTCAPRSQSH